MPKLTKEQIETIREIVADLDKVYSVDIADSTDFKEMLDSSNYHLLKLLDYLENILDNPLVKG